MWGNDGSEREPLAARKGSTESAREREKCPRPSWEPFVQNAAVQDRHLVWLRVTSDREQLEPLAPEGFEPVVEVYLHGRQQPFVPVAVETRPDGWIRFQTTSGKPFDEGKWHPDDSLIHVPETAVARVEIVLRKLTRDQSGLGFVVTAADD
jgi:hypothetical protein